MSSSLPDSVHTYPNNIDRVKIGQSIIWLLNIIVIVSACMNEPSDSEPYPGDSNTDLIDSNVVAVSGRIIDDQRNAIVGVDVYLVHNKCGVFVLDRHIDETIASPSAVTDDQGKFEILATPEFVSMNPEIGIRSMSFVPGSGSVTAGFSIMIRKETGFEIFDDDILIPIVLDEDLGDRIRIGEKVASDKTSIATLVIRDPSGGLRVAGTYIMGSC